MSRKIVLPTALLVLAILACNLTKTPNGESPLQSGANSTPNPDPVNINEGLASLDSYEMTVRISRVSPAPAQSSTTDILRQHTSDPNASYTQVNMSVSGGEEGTSLSKNDIYQIGNDQCTGSDADGWTWNSSTPIEAEMQSLITSMIGLTPLIDNPVFQAAETVNGIPSNHFTFKVSGLGATSGAVVNVNEGNYWLAVDGQYIVKYVLVIEMSTSADSDPYHMEVYIEMTQVNQPVSIAFPEGCLAASQDVP